MPLTTHTREGRRAAFLVSQRISVIIPVLDEAGCILQSLSALQPFREAGHELIVVDGGSQDSTPLLARLLADRVLTVTGCRARQMNAGVSVANGAYLLFLHADTTLPPRADRLIIEGLQSSGKGWGRFDVRLSGQRTPLRIIERFLNLRSRLTGIASGSQGMFVRRFWFEAVEGFPETPVMEDIALSRKLKRRGHPLCLRQTVVTSSRHWEARGIIRSALLRLQVRIAVLLGRDAERLANIYYGRGKVLPEPRRSS